MQASEAVAYRLSAPGLTCAAPPNLPGPAAVRKTIRPRSRACGRAQLSDWRTEMDFAALPPEINSARMYAGAGSAPMWTAATAWDGLGAELSSAAAAYRAVVSGLTRETWRGPASTSMQAAAIRYASWLSTTGEQVKQAASQASAAAAAYEAAFAATVPPALVAQNRAA